MYTKTLKYQHLIPVLYCNITFVVSKPANARSKGYFVPKENVDAVYKDFVKQIKLIFILVNSFNKY